MVSIIVVGCDVVEVSVSVREGSIFELLGIGAPETEDGLGSREAGVHPMDFFD